MGRNRSKVGVLADDCPQRIGKWLQKLKRAEDRKKYLLNKLNRVGEKTTYKKDPRDSVEIRIENIKETIRELNVEIRELEKDLKISRKQSDYFGGKGKRSKYQKLRGIK